MPPVNRTYWRSVEDLTQSPEFKEWMHREFPEGASELGSDAERRNFMKVMGASFALAGLGLAGCRRWPETKIVPAANQPANRTPGVPVLYATTMPVAGVGIPVLAKSYDGRPIKLDGNAAHPAGCSGTTPSVQGRILELYDPDRSRTVLSKGVQGSWSNFQSWVSSTLGPIRASGGEGMAVLSESLSGPSADAMRARFAKAYPKAKWYEWEAANDDSERAGTESAFGRAMRPVPAFDKASVVVSLDADFLASDVLSARWSRDFARTRRIDPAADPKTQRLSRLYVIEAGLSATGMNADERIALRAADIAVLAAAVASRLGVAGGDASLKAALDAMASSDRVSDLFGGAQTSGPQMKIVDALVADLQANRGKSLLMAGPRQPAAVHALVALINDRLGNIGTTVRYMPVTGEPRTAQLRALAADMSAGRVKALAIIGGNPAYDAPADLDFAKAMANVPAVAHLSLYANETSRSSACSFHVPRAHPLEAWGDTLALDGSISMIQPLIEPMVAPDQGGVNESQFVAALCGEDVPSSWDAVRATHMARTGLSGPAFEAAWRGALDRGYWDGTAAMQQSPSANGSGVASVVQAAAAMPAASGLELAFTFDAKVYDGRFSNISWMQELPDAVSKITWDNAALMGPATAETLGVKGRDMVTITAGSRSMQAVAWVVPGHAEQCVTIALGYGRGPEAGRIADGAGFNAYPMRTTGAPGFASGVSVKRTGETYPVATTQDHGSADALVPNVPHDGVQERLPTLVREASLDEYREHPDFARHATHVVSRLSLWEEKNLDGAHFRWAMSIDLGSCTGCGACITACQAENNIPVVGKDQVLRGREMHWIRVDRYFRGHDPKRPDSYAVQPVTCLHCENAPCEQVCPVAATVHDADGLNSMVYNRCIGTRYCSNNCPYKVRRFNFFDYQRRDPERSEGWMKVKPEYYVKDGPDIWLRMQFNPEVTVRMRGVMEKCTFCTQRIQAAKIKYKNEWARAGGIATGSANFSIPDGAIVTACQQACPAEAIVFGDLNDPKSRVSQLQRSGRSYDLLEELNTKPRLKYLARVTNPAIPRPSSHGHGHGSHGGHGDAHGSSNGHSSHGA